MEENKEGPPKKPGQNTSAREHGTPSGNTSVLEGKTRAESHNATKENKSGMTGKPRAGPSYQKMDIN